MSLNLGTEIDARELDPYESTRNGIIQQVNMNGNYEVDFGQGRMKYISECTLQEILLARRVVQDREKWQLDIQRKMDTLLPEDWITDNVHIEAMAAEGGQFINAATQAVPPVMTARHTQTQWIRSMLVCRLGVFVLTNADGDITNRSRISASCRFNHRIRGTERTVQRHDHS